MYCTYNSSPQHTVVIYVYDTKLFQMSVPIYTEVDRLPVSMIYSELPVLGRLPWLLSAGRIYPDTNFAMQLGKIPALLYVFLASVWRPRLSLLMGCTLLLCFSVCVSLFGIFTMASTQDSFGDDTASAFRWGFLALAWISGSVGSVSMLIFYPWGAGYMAAATSGISTGVGATGLLAFGLSLLQQPSALHEAGASGLRFGTPVYFGVVAVLALLPLPAFYVIERSRYGRNLKAIRDVSTPDVATIDLPLLPTVSVKPVVLASSILRRRWRSLVTLVARSRMEILCASLSCFMQYLLPALLPSMAAPDSAHCSDYKTVLFWLTTTTIHLGSFVGRGMTFCATPTLLRRLLVPILIFQVAAFGGGLVCAGVSGLRAWVPLSVMTAESLLHGFALTSAYIALRVRANPGTVEQASLCVAALSEIASLVWLSSVIVFICPHVIMLL